MAYLGHCGRILVSVFALVVSVSHHAQAAIIDHININQDLEGILISGEIVKGDDSKFRELTIRYPNAVVVLDSPGGMLQPALEMGRLISIRGYRTLVLDDGICTSSCALMWIAGTPRLLAPHGRLGFHASYRDEGGRLVETGVGNAMIGHYLSQLHLSEQAVIFTTKASPYEISWLNEASRNQAGINFDTFGSKDRDANFTASQTVAISPPPHVYILRAGAEIPLITREELTTTKKQLRVGQRFQMEVSGNVLMNGVTVIPSGTPAIGEITEVRNKGMWGKSGYIGARIVSLSLAGRHVRLTGSFDDKGVTGTGGVVASIAIIPLAGFFTTGTSAFIASGSATKGFLDEDIAFRPVAVQPQVIEVPAAPPEAAPAPSPSPTPAAD